MAQANPLSLREGARVRETAGKRDTPSLTPSPLPEGEGLQRRTQCGRTYLTEYLLEGKNRGNRDRAEFA